MLTVNYQNILYKINAIKLKESDDLNFLNMYNSVVYESNIINKLNVSFELENRNSSYLIVLFGQKYLLIKNNNQLIVTNLSNRKSQVLKNKDNFKLGNGNYDYSFYNNLIIPVTTKKIFDNNYGTSFNIYIPRI